MHWRLAPGAEVAGFIVEELLAQGSFGTVYRARRGGRHFAIKLVPMDSRGEREVDALRLMRHPNVVCFHGYGLWPDEQPRFLVLAMELVEGRALDTWADEENPSALELVGQVLLPLALTLEDVHAAGVVHRDIKEANILMREADGQPVLVDFGAAGLEGARRLTMRLPPGTPEYRSPEVLRFARQWEGGPYPFTPRDDLWAMGVATYWLLTRRLPFGARRDPGMVRAILHETPRAPHELNPRVPLALGELCLRMLEKQPEARYADARALAQALSAEWARADRSWREPLFPSARRRRRAVFAGGPRRGWWAAGLGLTAVVGGGALLAVQRTELPAPPPMQQDNSCQEIAPALLTGEVGHGATPEKSFTPAPVANPTNSEDPSMLNPSKKTTRALVAASCVAGSAACVGGPQYKDPPKPEACPPGAVELQKQLGIHALRSFIEIHPFNVVPVPADLFLSEGKVTAEIMSSWGKYLMGGEYLYGELFFGKGRVYGRFTRMRMPDGQLVPVCMEIVEPGNFKQRGAKMQPGGTSEKARVTNMLSVEAVRRFE